MKTPMIQKQTLGVVLGLVVIALLGTAVWLQFQQAMPETEMSSKNMTDASASQTTNTPVPENVDDITASIVSESRVDATAMDDEETGMLEEMNAESDSVNNLDTSYDKDSF